MALNHYMASYHHHITKQLAPLIKQAETQKWKFLLSNHWMIHVPLLIVTGRVMGNHPCQGFKAESPWKNCGKHFLRTYMPWVMKQCFLNSRLHDVIVVQGFYVCQVSFWQNLIVKIKHVASKFANASPTSLFYTDEHINFFLVAYTVCWPKSQVRDTNIHRKHTILSWVPCQVSKPHTLAYPFLTFIPFLADFRSRIRPNIPTTSRKMWFTGAMWQIT